MIDGPLTKPLLPRILRLALVVCAVPAGTLALAGPTSAASTGVVAWGDSEAGQLGDGNNMGPEDCYPGFPEPCSLVPVSVSGLSKASSIATGGAHGLALLKDGTVMAWGGNGDGALGAGNITSLHAEEVIGPETCEVFLDHWEYFPCSMTPIAVSGLGEAAAVAAGGGFSLALLKNGTVMAWGYNEAGVLGNLTPPRISTVPVAVGGLSEVTAIAAGEGFALALRKNGTVMGWGENGDGQLGEATGPKNCEECIPTPVTVSGLSEVVAIAAGGRQSLALLKDGTVMAWGANREGQLGDGAEIGPESCPDTVACSRTPVAVSDIGEATAIAAGSTFRGGSPGQDFALLKDGTVMAWGANGEGELGNGTTSNSDVPVAVCAVGETAPCAQHLSGVTAITGGPGHALAILGNGTVVGWGNRNYQGQLGDGTRVGSDVPVPVDGLSAATAISAGGRFSLAFGTLASLPRVARLEPESGPARGGTSVRITGSHFTGVSAVRFGSSAACFTVDSETEITAISPPTTGTGYVTLSEAVETPPRAVYVTVQTAAGTSPDSPSSLDLFEYGPPETEISPSSCVPPSSGGSSSPAPTEPPPVPPLGERSRRAEPKVLTREQKLAKALKQCEKDRSKSKRAACAKRAREKYTTKAKKKSKQKRPKQT